MLLLVPCCLDKRTDMPLKMRARELGIDPYDAKVDELSGLMAAVPAEVDVIREGEMRTQGGVEGGKGCKNAIVVGRKLSLGTVDVE